MAISHLYPNQRPTLNLNFARSKTLDPRITFTRNSTATYVGSDGLIKTAAAGEARFDHDPVTGDCRGLLIEELRTNQILNSQVFESGIVLSFHTALDNAAVAPDGTMTAASILETPNNTTHDIWHTSNQVNQYAQSIFIKPNGREYFSLRFWRANNDWHIVVFHLSGEGSIASQQQGSSSSITEVVANIESLSNGWYRISAAANQTNTNFPLIVDTCTGPNPTVNPGHGAESYVGDPTKGYFVWGAQSEYNASFSTSYIPTSGSTVTRAADLCIIRNNTWLDIWNTPGSKTIVCEGLNSVYSSAGAVNGQGPLMFDITYPYNGQLRNFYFLLNAAARNPVVRATAPAVENYHNNAKPGNTDPAFFKGAVTFQLADNRISSAFNGTIATSEAKQSSANFILNKLKDPASNLNDNALRIGGQDIAPNNWRWNGPISRFVIYNDEVSNETLEALTR